MGLMHTALGNNIADFLTGEGRATTLADIEAAYLTAAKEAGQVSARRCGGRPLNRT